MDTDGVDTMNVRLTQLMALAPQKQAEGDSQLMLEVAQRAFSSLSISSPASDASSTLTSRCSIARSRNNAEARDHERELISLLTIGGMPPDSDFVFKDMQRLAQISLPQFTAAICMDHLLSLEMAADAALEIKQKQRLEIAARLFDHHTNANLKRLVSIGNVWEEWTSQLAVLALHLLYVLGGYDLKQLPADAQERRNLIISTLQAVPGHGPSEVIVRMDVACAFLMEHLHVSRQPERFGEGILLLYLCGYRVEANKLLCEWWNDLENMILYPPCFREQLDGIFGISKIPVTKDDRQKTSKPSDTLFHFGIIVRKIASVFGVSLRSASQDQFKTIHAHQEWERLGRTYAHPLLGELVHEEAVELQTYWKKAMTSTEDAFLEPRRISENGEPAQLGLFVTADAKGEPVVFRPNDRVCFIGGVVCSAAALLQEGGLPSRLQAPKHARPHELGSSRKLYPLPLMCSAVVSPARDASMKDGMPSAEADVNNFPKGHFAREARANEVHNVVFTTETVIICENSLQIPLLIAIKEISKGEEIVTASRDTRITPPTGERRSPRGRESAAAPAVPQATVATRHQLKRKAHQPAAAAALEPAVEQNPKPKKARQTDMPALVAVASIPPIGGASTSRSRGAASPSSSGAAASGSGSSTAALSRSKVATTLSSSRSGTTSVSRGAASSPGFSTASWTTELPSPLVDTWAIRERPEHHIALHPLVLEKTRSLSGNHSGAVVVTVDVQQQLELGFLPQARESESFEPSAKYCMSLGLVNNGGLPLADPKSVIKKRSLSTIATAAEAADERFPGVVPLPSDVTPSTKIFDFIDFQWDALEQGGRKMFHLGMPPEDAKCVIYCKDASFKTMSLVKKLAASKPSEQANLALGFFPVLDGFLGRILSTAQQRAKPAIDRLRAAAVDVSGGQSGDKAEFLADRILKRELFKCGETIRRAIGESDDSDVSKAGRFILHSLYPHESVLQRTRLDNLSHIPFEGVQSSYVYIKENFQFFNLHIEQMLFSFNHHQLEGESLWIIVPFDQLDKLYEVGAELYEKLYKPKGLSEAQLLTLGRALVLSKQIFLSPNLLRRHKIRFTEKRLRAGEILSAHGGCAHFGFSTTSGKTISVASNSCTDQWLKQGLEYLIDHFKFVEELRQLWCIQRTPSYPKGRKRAPRSRKGKTVPSFFLGKPPRVQYRDQLKDVYQLLHKAVNNCPLIFVCAFLRGLYADLCLLLQVDGRERAVCSYPNVKAEEIVDFIEQIKQVLKLVHGKKLHEFLKEMDDDCSCSPCKKGAAKRAAARKSLDTQAAAASESDDREEEEEEEEDEEDEDQEEEEEDEESASDSDTKGSSSVSGSSSLPAAQEECLSMVCYCTNFAVDELWTEEISSAEQAASVPYAHHDHNSDAEGTVDDLAELIRELQEWRAPQPQFGCGLLKAKNCRQAFRTVEERDKHERDHCRILAASESSVASVARDHSAMSIEGGTGSTNSADASAEGGTEGVAETSSLPAAWSVGLWEAEKNGRCLWHACATAQGSRWSKVATIEWNRLHTADDTDLKNLVSSHGLYPTPLRTTMAKLEKNLANNKAEFVGVEDWGGSNDLMVQAYARDGMAQYRVITVDQCGKASASQLWRFHAAEGRPPKAKKEIVLLHVNNGHYNLLVCVQDGVAHGEWPVEHETSIDEGVRIDRLIDAAHNWEALPISQLPQISVDSETRGQMDRLHTTALLAYQQHCSKPAAASDRNQLASTNLDLTGSVI
jgi:hypothetical protein